MTEAPSPDASGSDQASHHRCVNHKQRSPLPTEIHNAIIWQFTSKVDREDLKICRLVNRSFNNVSTPILFDTIHVSKSIFSLQRLQNIANTPWLAQHVKRITIHSSTWADSDAFDCLDFTGRILQLYKIGETQTYLDQWLPHTREYADKLNYFTQGKPPQWETGLPDAIRGEISLSRTALDLVQSSIRSGIFPNLQQLCWPEFDRRHPSEYHLRTTGRQQMFQSMHYLKPCRFLTYDLNLRLRFLELQNVLISGMGQPQFIQLCESKPKIFSQLETLHIGFIYIAPQGFSYVYDANAAFRGVRLFFDACATTLKELSFKLEHQTVGRFALFDNDHQLTMTRIVLEAHFPSLRRLVLKDFRVSEESFINFLLAHQSTLKELELTNWTMPVSVEAQYYAIDVSLSSFTRLFWRIPDIIILRDFRLSGIFTTVHENVQCACYWRIIPREHRNDIEDDEAKSDSHQPIKYLNHGVDRMEMLTKVQNYLTQTDHRGNVCPTPFPFPDSIIAALESDMSNLDIPLLMKELASDTEISNRGGWKLWTLDAHPIVASISDESWHFEDPWKMMKHPLKRGAD